MWPKTLIVLALLVLSTTPAFAQGPRRLTPLVVDGERYFRLQWEAADQNGSPRIQGSIFNDYGFAARKIRLLIDSLDASGGVTAQTLAYLPLDLTPGTQMYFDAKVPARADSYRVSVFEWEWIQAGSGGDPR